MMADMTRTRSVATSLTAWIVGAGAAIGVGLVALSLIGPGLANGPIRPLSPNGLAPAATPIGGSGDPSTSPTPSATSVPGPTTPPPTMVPVDAPGGATPAKTTPPAAPPPPVDQTLSSAGGAVVVRCRTDGAYLVGWSPAPGFTAGDIVRGPAATVQVSFEQEEHELTVSVQCVYGAAHATVTEEESGHHGGHG
jgi:hypothetical protein